MPPKSNEPYPTQRQTRSTNANAHPGNVIIKASGRRSKTEIEEEKKAKEDRRKARETKKAIEKASITEIAKLENRMMAEDAMEESKFPRRRLGATGMH
jgi:hypothetical protein